MERFGYVRPTRLILRRKMNNFCQDKSNLFEYGIISRRGYRDNVTDCEVDIILIHVPSGKARRFHGTWYDENYEKEMQTWIESFPKSKKGITIEKLNSAYSCPNYTVDSGRNIDFK